MKFKVGDEVRALCDSLHKGIKKGEIGIVKAFDYECEDGKKRIRVVPKGECKDGLFLPEELELVEPKPTKNQRITALENELSATKEEVAELKLIVNQLRESNITIQDVQEHFGLLPSTDNVVEDKPKTPNELRAEIIEKAKGFVEELKVNHSGYCDGKFMIFESIYKVDLGIEDNKRKTAVCDCEFVVNEEKRTIVALLRGVDTNKVYRRGIAKCMPGDVFNSHIGKAIALGRALGLDVSEFEQAVQPTFAIGQKVHYKSPFMTNFEGDYEIKGFEYNGDIISKDKGVLAKKGATIINDSNAIYGGVE